MLSTFAQVVHQGGVRGGDSDWLLHLCTVLIILVAGATITGIILSVMGWTIPSWVWKIAGILLAAFVGIIALKFLWTMAW